MNETIAKKTLMRACRQLEICGWCPHEDNHRLDIMYSTCPTAQKYGIDGCHNCIRKHFAKEVTAFERALS